MTGAVVGGLMGFLLFNVYPAKVFMGDTGSLALGGFVAGAAYMMQMPLFILLIGLIYLVEVLSVMIQVTYFKATHGKRIFKMAPIHHHFELCGWSETSCSSIFCNYCCYVPDRTSGIIRCPDQKVKIHMSLLIGNKEEIKMNLQGKKCLYLVPEKVESVQQSFWQK